MQRVYMDTNIVVSFVERRTTLFPALKARMVSEGGASQVHCVTSDLVRLESRVLPLRTGDLALLARFDAFFEVFSAYSVPMDRNVFDLATSLRSQYNLKTPDALHLAAAINAQCDEFWSNDQHLAKAAQNHLRIVTFESTP